MCDCDRALELLSLSLDGALNEEEKRELEEHLGACDACRAANRELEIIHGVMPELIEEVPEGFHQRVMEKIAAEKVVTFPVKKAHAAWRSWASLAAVFAVILLGAGTLSQLDMKSGGPPAAIAAVPQDEPGGEAGGFAAMDAAPSQYAGAEDSGGSGEDMGKTQNDENEAAIPPTPQFTANPGSAPQTAVLPTPQPTQAPESAPQPRVATMSALLSPQQAGTAAAEREYPGVAVTDLSGADGSYSGWTAVLSDGTAVELHYLGLAPNGEYYEFSLRDQGADQERNRFAVMLDGGAVETLNQLGREAYDALTGVEN